MSYIEDIQKINKLAKEMLSHGMATSLDEAVSKAQETLRKSGAITLDLSDMKDKLAEQDEKKKEVLGEEKVEPQTGQVAATIEKPAMPRISWQEAMGKNTQYVVEQFKKQQEMMEQMGNEIIKLRREIQSLKNIPQNVNVPQNNTREQVINIEEPSAPQQQAPVQQQQQPKTPEQESHPKQGGFSSEDVSIEKVFYFGNR